MKCVVCGEGELLRDSRSWEYTYKGKTVSFPAVEAYYCPACGEAELTPEDQERVSALQLEFNRQVNLSLYDPAAILSVRKKLGLDQQEAAEIFGGGKTGFSRYETGRTKPPKSLVELLRLLDRHPELLAEIRQG